ncbi:MAG TPA: hypothetical protein VNF24_08925 [Candidatus Acidoferrales bacterium]|nr:hypothetical protein [Candidatus Acidoferrales bacterium]
MTTPTPPDRSIRAPITSGATSWSTTAGAILSGRDRDISTASAESPDRNSAFLSQFRSTGVMLTSSKTASPASTRQYCALERNQARRETTCAAANTSLPPAS